MDIGLITNKSYWGAAKRLQLPLQCNVIIMEEVEEEKHFNAASGSISTKKEIAWRTNSQEKDSGTQCSVLMLQEKNCWSSDADPRSVGAVMEADL